MPTKRKLLFLTNSEHGAANIMLAVSYEILLGYQDVEVHFASFPGLEKHVRRISDQASKSMPNVRIPPIIFHPLVGPGITETISQQLKVPIFDAMIHPPGVAGAIKGYRGLSSFAAGWTGEEHLKLYASIAGYIQDINPTLVVLDPVLIPGVEACRDLKTKHAILSPNGMKDLLASVQPQGAVLWKYPVVASGFPYPLPKHLILLNLYLFFRLVMALVLSPALRVKNAFLKKNSHLPAPPFSIPTDTPDVQWLFPSRPEIDIPISVIPDNVTPCGPIIMDFEPVGDSDAELAQWLALKPTVVVNLGSLYRFDKASATSMLDALELVLKQVNNIQILWKLRSISGQSSWVEGLKTRIEAGNLPIRISEWIPADMASVLSCGTVVAAVHHGGASSYHEAICAGVPQVVLPMWSDLYDFKTRVEYHGIGLWGSKNAAPGWTAEELGNVLLKVVQDSGLSREICRKAQSLAKICRPDGGRKVAAKKIMETFAKS